MPKRLFVFDLDDTLMWNSWTYGVAFRDFYNYLMDIWGLRLPALGSVASFSEKIDHALGSKTNPATGEPYGFSMERFPTSLVHTYEHLCDMGFGEYDKQAAQDVYRIGMSAFDEDNYRKAGLVEGAEEFLNLLSENKEHMALVTKGDVRVQNPKIKILGLKRWFPQTLIVDSKSPETFSSRAEVFSVDAETPKYSVGNSYKSDISPALEAGYRGIYIPCYTWVAEEFNEQIDKENVLVVPEIKDVSALYKRGVI